MYKILVTFLLVSCFAIGCKSQKFSYDNLPEDQIVFGQGGGMAGGVKTYTLLENGQLFVHNSITKISEELNAINSERAAEFFIELDGLSFKTIQFEHPGNRYYFLGHKTDEGEHQIVWGGEDHDTPDPVRAMYKQLMETINK